MNIRIYKGQDTGKAIDTVNKISHGLRKRGFSFETEHNNGEFKVKNIRIVPEIRGYNVGGHSYYWGVNNGDSDTMPHRTRVLTWEDWIELIDASKLQARVYSLGGKFLVRDREGRYNTDDWQDMGFDNVGSNMYPVERRHLYWKPVCDKCRHSEECQCK